jgi:23S rRNA (pseudouridine1915-N3)-methyltransferase
VKVRIVAVGRAKAGPEAALAADYMARAGKAGRALGLGPVELSEIDERKAHGKAAQADALRRACGDGAYLIAMDERGAAATSPDFADWLAGARDAGRREAALLIGGADGLDPALVAECDRVLSFGRMVWPHMLVRAMLAEQVYRATQILAGTPYHRV